ncbi:uncharacterized protein LOC9647038 isoform X2 [Selaginella moellendorffii]|uniref:uncharacterized protein LOC9647038 isoform X2 n=1 Tax=Selaginella moellendorffii TaxID=88036 RepID=UPI000D1D0C24|nr:uncharacterized protein LOC9647038 isoform X2 [Selaginella moellendorffii]|eukprot:XP_002980044.2 uncharacterized protein LOC9647038 isoform X2 [Selaginella moellendorffii]
MDSSFVRGDDALDSEQQQHQGRDPAPGDDQDQDQDEENEDDEEELQKKAAQQGCDAVVVSEEDSGILDSSFSGKDHRGVDPLTRFVLPLLDNDELDRQHKQHHHHHQDDPGSCEKLRDQALGFHKQGSGFPYVAAPANPALGSAATAGSGGRDCMEGERVYRKGIWMLPELLALQTARKAGMGKFGYRTRNNKSEKERWQDIEDVLWLQGVQRSADQCRSRWEYISREFRRIVEYETSAPMGQSYWSLSQADRKDKDLPINFYGDLFHAMNQWMGAGKGAPMEGAAKAMETGSATSNGNGSRNSCLQLDNPGSKPAGKKRKAAYKQNNRSLWPREIQLQPEAGTLLLCNCSIVHVGASTNITNGDHVLIRNKRIAYVGPSLAYYASQVLDLGGRFLIPGLCDAHVHVTAISANLHDMSSIPASLITARATKVLQNMLMRGFTTVRDVGGCDWGLAKAVEEGTILGPRILFGGHALSQTGGHGDMRLAGEDDICSCSGSLALGRVCDGVAEARKAARDELRKGAYHIKIMASGGVSSPTDHLTSLQFSAEEISAIVEEATHCGKYVCAHAYTAAAVKRALELGVRSIEHGNLADTECLDLMKVKGAFLVPTLVTYHQIRRQGEASGMAPELVAKVGDLLERGLDVVALADQRGVNICFGTDLLGSMHDHQLEEFSLRSRVQSPIAILKSATSTCAQLFNMDGQIGCVAEGAYADLLVLDKNPIADIGVLADPNNLVMILKQGETVKLPKGLATKMVDGRPWTQITS